MKQKNKLTYFVNQEGLGLQCFKEGDANQTTEGSVKNQWPAVKGGGG